MPRLFVEGRGANDRDTVAYLMRELDDEAAKNGHRITGDVTISEGESPFVGRFLRLEADCEPA